MMIKVTFANVFTSIRLCVAVPALVAGLLPGLSYGAPPPLLLTHPISSTAPLPLTEEPTPNRRFRGGQNTENVPPLSLAVDDSDGVLYSRDVNRIYDAVDRIDATGGTKRSNSQRRDETWLATALGVKCVDRTAGVVRHYGRAEGLPGPDVVAICADASDVWCLVQDRVRQVFGAKATIRLHLC